jgi:hypothetical protein
VTSSAGVATVVGRAIVIRRLTLAEDASIVVRYGDKRHGGPGAVPPKADVGDQDWQASERSGAIGRLAGLSLSPAIRVIAPNGAGAIESDLSTVANGARGNTITFTFKPGAGGIDNGASLVLAVPNGWSAPSTVASAPGYTRASAGKLSVAGREIHVEALGGGTPEVTIVYGSRDGGGPGATAPSGASPIEQWPAAERSSSAGKALPLAEPVTIGVLAADGSGQLARATSPSAPGSHGQTVVFLYTAARGGMLDGTLALDVPVGWSAPSADPHAAGYVTSSLGSLSLVGRRIVISGVTLDPGATIAVIYGNRAGGGPGATAPAATGPRVWPAAEQSSRDGTLRPLSR